MLKIIQLYISDKSGQFAVWFALLAVPLIASASFVLDFQQALKVKKNMESALDIAVLSAAMDGSLNLEEKEDFAKRVFNENYMGDTHIELTAKASSNRVELTGYGEVATTIAAITGVNHMKIDQKSAAEITKGNIICILTLNPSGAESFVLRRGAVFDSPNCSVQVNSNSSTAAYVDRNSRALAKDFCVVGGATGFFSPHVNTECSVVEDPYKNVVPPASGSCINLKAYSRGKTARIGDNVTLQPGTYCSNVKMSGVNINMMPGIYIFENVELWVNQASQVHADGVTIVLKGEDAVFYIEQGSDFYIKAPATGITAGLAIFQDADSALGRSRRLPTGTSELSGGSNMVIIGTVYLPTQGIEIFGQSSYGNTAPATSYIGYNVNLGSNSKVTLDVDHSSAGLPPILPRSDEGARLVQ